MTLFRKVFQGGSQPASSGEVFDEAALRQAFIDAGRSDDEPLKLDPFAYGAEPEEAAEDDAEQWDDLTDVCDAAAEYDRQDFTEAEKEVAEAEDDDDAVQDVTEDPLSEVDPVAETSDPAVEHVGEDLGQSDEEIAACLDRALAAEAPVTEEFEASPPEEEAEVQEMTRPDQDETLEADADDVCDLDLSQFAESEMAARMETAPAAAEPDDDHAGLLPEEAAARLDLEAVPAPAVGRVGRRAGRVKTRLLGFNRTGDGDSDPFGQAPEATASAQREKFPVGWLVIIEGPGVGNSFSIFTGASMIGRGEDQVIRLDFGDTSISRHNHAAVAYDEEQNKFYIGHGGKSNIIRRNARPVLSTEELHHADLIRIGETTLRFVALCGSDFQWNASGGTHAGGV